MTSKERLDSIRAKVEGTRKVMGDMPSTTDPNDHRLYSSYGAFVSSADILFARIAELQKEVEDADARARSVYFNLYRPADRRVTDEYWRCFQCHATFEKEDVAGAQAHFGGDSSKRPTCERSLSN